MLAAGGSTIEPLVVPLQPIKGVRESPPWLLRARPLAGTALRNENSSAGPLERVERRVADAEQLASQGRHERHRIIGPHQRAQAGAEQRSSSNSFSAVPPVTWWGTPSA